MAEEVKNGADAADLLHGVTAFFDFKDVVFVLLESKSDPVRVRLEDRGRTVSMNGRILQELD